MGKLVVKVLEKNERKLLLEVEGETHTLLNLITTALLEDPDVEIAYYDIDHPLRGVARVYVKTKSKRPEDALKEAVERVRKLIAECREVLAKVL